MRRRNIVRLVLEVDNRILMLERRLRGGGFTLAGGYIKPGETPREAVVREVSEETGMVLKEEDLEMLHVLHYQNTTTTSVVFFFRAKKWEGKPVNMEPEKFSQLKWFPIKKLPLDTRPVIKKALGEWLNNRSYSEFNAKKWKKEKQLQNSQQQS